MTDEAALDALGNPNRRAVLRLLRDGEQTVRELTDALPVTQSAVSQHLRVLHDAGLVRVREHGTRRLYSVDLGTLGEVRAWVDSFWDDVLTAFVDHVESSDDTGATS
ncbi:MAG: metalloregulator ArsR/SmtB family transcription factor [Actinomycetota bacterium]